VEANPDLVFFVILFLFMFIN